MTNQESTVRERWNKTDFTNNIWLNKSQVDVEHDKIADFWLQEIDTARSEEHNRSTALLEGVRKVCEAHKNWKPTEGYASDEEKGYQKGIQAEAHLLSDKILSIISAHLTSEQETKQ